MKIKKREWKGGISLPLDLRKKIKELAKKEHRTLQGTITHILLSYFEHKEKDSDKKWK